MAYPLTISRGSYSFTAWEIFEERAIKEFLGIEPKGDDIDAWLGKRKLGELEDWRNYWIPIFSTLGMRALIEFTGDKFIEYKNKLAAPYIAPLPTTLETADIDWDQNWRESSQLWGEYGLWQRTKLVKSPIAMRWYLRAGQVGSTYRNPVIAARAKWTQLANAAGYKDILQGDSPLPSGEIYIVGVNPETYIPPAPPMKPAYPKEIIRLPYTITTNSLAQETIAKEFLGIEPAGLPLDEWLAQRDLTNLEAWRDFWITKFKNAGLNDWAAFVLSKFEEYKALAPSPFSSAWDKLLTNVSAGNWIDAAKNLILLPFASIISKDIETLQMEFPITPVPTGINPLILAKLGSKITIWGRMVQIMKNLATQAKQNPFIAIFAVTEIPQLAVMSTFAFKWFAEQKGESQTGVSISLNNIYSAWEAAGFKFNTAVKNKDFIGAANLLGNMIVLTDEYNNTITSKKDVLTTAGEYEARAAIGDMMTTANEEMKKSVGVAVLPERIRAMVRDIIDGDTIDVGLEAYDDVTGNNITLPQYSTSGHARIRVLGINAPEKSPKGEIACSDTELFKVAAKWADNARNVWLPLNDKQVILKVDPANATDTFSRILAIVEYQGKDFGLQLVKAGLACGYYRGTNKYLNQEVYSKETLTAQSANIGMWADVLLPVPGEVPGVPGEGVITAPTTISITSVPSNAKVFIDGIAAKHNTPSDEIELKDVIRLFSPGAHKLKITKAGMSAEEDIEIIAGQANNFILKLETVGLPAPAPIPGVPEVPEVPTEIMKITSLDLFNEMKTYYTDRMYLSKSELTPLLAKYDTSDIQSFIDEIWAYYIGRMYLSKKELILLGMKYSFDVSGL